MSVVTLSAFETKGWAFRLYGLKVKATPPENADEAEIEELRQSRNRLRTLLSIRAGEPILADLEHDAALIADRNGCGWDDALNGAAISAGLVNWAEAEQLIRLKEQANG